MQTVSRQEQILTLLLHTPGGLSIDDLSAHLEISRNAVNQHLAGLEKQQLIQETALNSTGGRPARYYGLTEKGRNFFPKQYSWFCNLLLDELAAECSEEALEKMLFSMGVKLGQSLAFQFKDKESPQKLQALVDLMQSLGYHASLAQTGDQISITAMNCVYHDLAQKHPQLCHFDRALISTLLETSIEQTHCMARQDCACRFQVLTSAKA